MAQFWTRYTYTGEQDPELGPLTVFKGVWRSENAREEDSQQGRFWLELSRSSHGGWARLDTTFTTDGVEGSSMWSLGPAVRIRKDGRLSGTFINKGNSVGLTVDGNISDDGKRLKLTFVWTNTVAAAAAN